MIELKELTDKTMELFNVKSVGELGQALIKACNDSDQLNSFCELVEEDLSKDWLQMIYQYYLADRKGKKQDYTPASLARFMGMLAGHTNNIVDMCAGSGALIIQTWNRNPSTSFTAIEIDENVIPFLLFNMVLRNIRCRVLQMDVLTDDKPLKTWEVMKGERFGRIVNNESSV